ncbi:MAG TPA: hypothetical protein VEB21_00265 [Terriglobales bacterium]|nr:hypothetical protein [Terriglobales bacterium]
MAKKKAAAASLDFSKARTYPLARRRSIVKAEALATPTPAGASLADFLAHLPDVLAARDLRQLSAEIARRHRRGKKLVLGMGAHPIKVGLSPWIVELMQRGILHGLAMNGAAIIHDFELAYCGQTSEDVAASLADGRFGMAAETGQFLNQAVRDAQHEEGLGHAVGRALVEAKLPNLGLSLLANAYRLGIPATVHVAIGTDIIHMHPSADGAAIGEATLCDFRRLAALVAGMRGGVFLNLGSAVLIPEVFVKALNLARNLGRRVDDLITVDMDFIRHYRPQMNIVRRPTEGSGKGYQLTGHHEIMFPLLCAAILESIKL